MQKGVINSTMWESDQPVLPLRKIMGASPTSSLHVFYVEIPYIFFLCRGLLNFSLSFLSCCDLVMEASRERMHLELI